MCAWYTHVGAQALLCSCTEAGGTEKRPARSLSTLFPSDRVSVNPDLAWWAASSNCPLVFIPYSTGVEVLAWPHPSSYLGAWGLNSGPLFCVANTITHWAISPGPQLSPLETYDFPPKSGFCLVPHPGCILWSYQLKEELLKILLMKAWDLTSLTSQGSEINVKYTQVLVIHPWIWTKAMPTMRGNHMG